MIASVSLKASNELKFCRSKSPKLLAYLRNGCLFCDYKRIQELGLWCLIPLSTP